MQQLTTISPHLYRYEDTCIVYALVQGDKAVLIDFGSGGILERLPEIGVNQVTDILMTHHHRDQGQGLPLAATAGIRIWVPHTEQDLFAAVDQHWQGRFIDLNYNMRQDRFSLLEPVPVSGTLRDYTNYYMNGFHLQILPTPGHTTGSITVSTEVDGIRAAFSGDLIAARGKVWSLAATQWSYNGSEGASSTIASLLDLKRRKFENLLPSHGDPIYEPEQSIDLLVKRLRRLLDLRNENKRLEDLSTKPYAVISPHLLWNQTSVATSYVLISESGKALMIDYGYDFVTGLAPLADRASRRPWLYTIHKLKEDFGISKVDVAIPTHYHDDHIGGFNLLQEVEGAQVWAPVNLAHILENPKDYDLPCLWPDPVCVDRILPLEKPVEWEEYELYLYELPGHTEYAAAIYFEVDGLRVLATGDQYQEAGPNCRWNYVYSNRFCYDDFLRSAELYSHLKPDMILSGHWPPFRTTPEYLKLLMDGGLELKQLHQELLHEDIVSSGRGGMEVHILPYRSELQAGKPGKFRIEVTNPFPVSSEVRVRMVLPGGWLSEPGEAIGRLEPGEAGELAFLVTPPEGVQVNRARIAADLVIGDRLFGQQAEALVDVNHIKNSD